MVCPGRRVHQELPSVCEASARSAARTRAFSQVPTDSPSWHHMFYQLGLQYVFIRSVSQCRTLCSNRLTQSLKKALTPQSQSVIQALIPGPVPHPVQTSPALMSTPGASSSRPCARIPEQVREARNMTLSLRDKGLQEQSPPTRVHGRFYFPPEFYPSRDENNGRQTGQALQLLSAYGSSQVRLFQSRFLQCRGAEGGP